ncbi:MAG: hypothetical protein M1442_02120 [Candidatus Thermoplasmatota archaeon]|nr:hypothetical protein [Candidatus Thermoplasmatota archaeon]
MNVAKALLAVFVVLAVVFAAAFAVEYVAYNSTNSKANSTQSSLNKIESEYANAQGSVVLKSAYNHWNYISTKAMTPLMGEYESNATLYWVGGPLNGTYSGLSSIQGVWEKFFAAWGAIWFFSQSEPTISVQGTNAIVDAAIQFVATPSSAPQQVNYLNITYTLKYTLGASGWHIYAEAWNIRGAGVLSYSQTEFSNLNYVAVEAAAFEHWDAVAIENVSLFNNQYTSNATLRWIGGPLTGTYTAISAIEGTWQKFFSIWSAVWFYTVAPPTVTVNGNVATVQSLNQFVLTPSTNQSQVQYLMINYTLNFVRMNGTWLIYNEVWHIVGTGFISFAQESVEWNTVNSLAFTHWNSIAIENNTSVLKEYASNATLNWVGGKLSGTYTGPAQINAVWIKFFSIWSAVWFYSESPPVIMIQGNNAYVSATIQFIVQNASNTSQFFFLNVSYSIHYYNFGFNPATGTDSYSIVSETFLLTGTGPLAKV